MAQGKQRNKEEVIRSLEPYFKLGCNVKKACAYAGIPYTTVDTWIQGDDDLRVKITAWQSEMSAQARRNWHRSLQEGNPQATLEWLKRKEKDEFSERTEQTGADGQAIVVRTTSYGDKPAA